MRGGAIPIAESESIACYKSDYNLPYVCERIGNWLDWIALVPDLRAV